MQIGGSAPADTSLARRLNLFDAVMMVVSGTIGAAIFITPADVLHAVPDPRLALLLWVAAGAFTLLAGLACAELSAMFPQAGGQYIFIKEAYGQFTAFLYGWMLFTAGNSGALAAMAISSAIFLGRAFPGLGADHVIASHALLGTQWQLTGTSLIAVATIVLLTAVNLRSVKVAAWLQNVTAMAFIVAILGIALLGLLFGHGSWSHFTAAPAAGVAGISLKGVGIAMIALLWTFDGWEFLSWIGGEIRNPRRNLPLALILGIALVIVTYLLANAVFLYALPPQELAAQPELADAAMTALFSRHAGTGVSLFIALISFGAASVVVLGGARIYYSMSQDGIFFRTMQRVHPRWQTPTVSLVAQGIWTSVLILSGRYEQLYTCFIFMMTLSYLLTVGAVFILRRTQPDRPRPYRCAGYPVLPLIYMLVAVMFVVSTLVARPLESITGLALAALGVPMYAYWHRAGRQVPPENAGVASPP